MKHEKFLDSQQFGMLDKANRFVRQRYEPADTFTKYYVESFLEELGFDLKQYRPTTKTKYVRCMSDFLECICWFQQCQEARKLIAWTGKNSDFVGESYGAEIAKEVKDSLIKHEFLFIHQDSSKRDGLARVYSFDPLIIHRDLKFKHYYSALVEVRNKKRRNDKGRILGGEKLSLKTFQPQVTAFESDMLRINKNMERHPLQLWSGNLHFCRRIFNNASLECGGRIYGDWQTESEEIRLAATIDSEKVCEVDLKASFLAIANHLFGDGAPLPFDAYSAIGFITEVKDGRDLAKALVTSYVGRRGRMTQFPRGKKDKKTKKALSLREKHNIPNKHNVDHYLDQILTAYPFLRSIGHCSVDLMFIESQIITTAILDLIDHGIVAYPVHDCLLVKISDRDRAIKALYDAMREILGGCIHMDVSYRDEYDTIQKEMIYSPLCTNPRKIEFKTGFLNSWNIEDDDVEVIDYYDNEPFGETYMM